MSEERMNRETARRLEIWYVCDQLLCNFDCSYCVTTEIRSTEKEWARDDSEERFRKILEGIARLPYRLCVRLETAGEPFVSRGFLEGAGWLSKQANVEFVELVTNGSLLKSRLSELVNIADRSKISLWITFHHTEISAERFLENVLCAKKLGISLMVNCLYFPDNSEAVKNMALLCKENEIPINVDLGKPMWDSYDNAQTALDEEYGLDSDFDLLMDHGALGSDRGQVGFAAGIIGQLSVFGLPCSAGYDYVTVNSNGDLYPCHPYKHFIPGSKIGSVFDSPEDIKLRKETYSPCMHEGTCRCKEDYFHVDFIRENRDHAKNSLGALCSSALVPSEKDLDPHKNDSYIEEIRTSRRAMVALGRQLYTRLKSAPISKNMEEILENHPAAGEHYFKYRKK